MPCNVLQPPTLPPLRPSSPVFISLFPSALPLSWSPSSVLPPPRFSRPSGSLPSWRCSIEIQFPPTHPSHLPTLSPFLYLLLYISYETPPHHSGDPQHPGKEATGCIPCDKLRGSIIHGNLLFKRLPSSTARPLPISRQARCKHENR